MVKRVCRWFFLALLIVPFVQAQNGGLLQRAKRETVIVPERFLRDFDPITVFFPKATGPSDGGSADAYERFVQIEPSHPVAARWLDAQTLQIRPVDPWPALTNFTVTADGVRHRLETLLSAPTEVVPRPGSTGLNPIDAIELTFSRPLDPGALAAMAVLELRPLPGLAGDKPRIIPGDKLRIKVLPRADAGSSASYRLIPPRPIEYGHAVALQLRLSSGQELDSRLARYRFETKPLFRLNSAGSDNRHMPLSADGVTFPADRALELGRGGLVLTFSAEPGPLPLAALKRMVRFEPAVANLRHHIDGRLLRLTFDADPERAYRLKVQYEPLTDIDGRPLERFAPAELFVYRPAPPTFLRWQTGKAIVERFGPRQLPIEGQGESRADLRIYRIEPTDPRFWPFPRGGLMVDESQRPAGPGEEPGTRNDLAENVRQLGAPLLSRLVDTNLPNSGARKQGFQLDDLLDGIAGANAPGTYLVGMRRIGESSRRTYARVTVTDLGLSIAEEHAGAAFAVTSLKTGSPVAGANIIVEGLDKAHPIENPRVLFRLTTDARGLAFYRHQQAFQGSIYRVRVEKDGDHLVFSPNSPPPIFENGVWRRNPYAWFNWLRREPGKVKDQARQKAFVFTERPLYRPEEKVFIKAYLRQYQAGRLSPPLAEKRTWLIRGPGNREWRFPLAVDANGSADLLFEADDTPAGAYTVFINDAKDRVIASRDFSKEAYRIPRFEVRLDGPEKVPLDQPFSVKLNAEYYAGGSVAGQTVDWRATQSPYNFTSDAFPGYTFSSSAGFGNGSRGDQGISRQDVTDALGSATLDIDPTLETDAKPRVYTVEATVSGADEQSVSAFKRIIALPPFLIGVQQAKVLQDSKVLQPKLLVLDHEGKPLAGQALRVRVKHRQWHSYLRESDFVTGSAQYVTDVVDVDVFEEVFTSAAEPLTPEIPVEAAGVYVIEIASPDRLGRLQQVTADVFVSGDEPVSWSKPKTLAVDTAWDKDRYDPGETASLVIKSPFQRGEALIVVETPDRNRYHRLPIRRGQGVFTLPVEANMATRVPVHLLLYQGRVSNDDTGRPRTLGAQTWLNVNPKSFRLNLSLDHPLKNLPGQTMPMTITMTDPDGNPLNGELTLWLVDRAVLALAREGGLDPVDGFVAGHPRWLRLYDSRNLLLGNIPVEDLPGGDGLAEGAFSLKGFESVRRNFKTMPFYEASIPVVNGRAEVQIPLPDNLTEFAVRAVGTDGASRFGVARSRVQIRLPVIVQTALPRFVRPGDRFTAGGIGRVVEGDGGAGSAVIEVEGLALQGESSKRLTWTTNQAEQLYFPMTVTSQANAPGEAANTVTIRMGVRRDADGAADAFEVNLPVRPDRAWQTESLYRTLAEGRVVDLPLPLESAREGTLVRQLVLSGQPGIANLLGALNYLDAYPYGCLEQRISATYPDLVLDETLSRVGRDRQIEKLTERVTALTAYLKTCLTDTGLFAYWPGGAGSVELTAYTVTFLQAVSDRGLPVESDVLATATRALTESLRSDYRHGLDGFRFAERAVALNALAKVGSFDRNYAFELAARASDLDLASSANILSTLLDQNLNDAQLTRDLIEDLTRSLNKTERDGQAVLEGLQYRTESWDGPWLASENRTLAEVMRALFRADSTNGDPKLILETLIRNSGQNGWGDTRANAAVLLAINELLAENGDAPPFSYELQRNGSTEQGESDGAWIRRVEMNDGRAGKLTITAAPNNGSVDAWFRTVYLPSDSGAEVRAKQAGFAVERTLYLVDPDGGSPRKRDVRAGRDIALKAGSIVEDLVRVVNPEDRYYVAVRVPLAAGFDPLNPRLATAPPEATPAGRLTQEPTYATYEDDAVTFYYNFLPKGTFDFYFRCRATTLGQFVQPPARAEMMYRQSVYGNSNGCRIDVEAR